jgi:hypothetical protein
MDEPGHTVPDLLGDVRISHLPWEEGPTSSRGDVSAEADRHRYTWRPGPALAAGLPIGFELPMEGLSLGGCHRRFRPVESTEQFVLAASVGGLAILDHLRNLDAEQTFAYHAARLIFQQAGKTRERFGRAYREATDLLLPGSHGNRLDQSGILPETVGLSAGEGRPWTVRELLLHGRKHANATGDSHPSTGRCIAYGLFVAAQRNPIDPRTLSEAEAKVLVRLALFDIQADDAGRDEGLERRATERLLLAMERHIQDGTEAFDRWFFEGRDNLIHLISKQVQGGAIPRPAVRRALLKLTFGAFDFVGDCVCLQMQAFQRALPQPLDETERAVFGGLYFKQPHLGGLPLVLLLERFDFLREAILSLMHEPGDRRRIGVLLRLLEYYASMTSTRRQADREKKQMALSRNANNGIARVGEIEDDVATAGTPDSAESRKLLEIFDQIRESREVRCPCGKEADLIGDWTKGGVEDDDFTIEFECGKCGRKIPVVTTREELQRAGRDIQ